ncbi:hypothetical protein HWV07_08465 [Natronomonas salina]|uniref:hypothetical protein n=1 Tax=Natronomonas salina TaxID=1710540 RepID=UPI0015B59C2F|nr:hypothetical protein [Natronomonas salina]QLD89060.1 hypothetical protein HWV07_08465 [Natronomonas salina]
MLPQTNIGEKTRRAVLKAAGAALGLAAAGTTIGHPGDGGNNKFYGGTEGYLGDNVADSSENAKLVGYHSGGGVGESDAQNAHKGAMSEMRIHDEHAFVTIFSARGEDSQRGLAIFDISDFTTAESEGDLERAELKLLSFVRNDNNQAACMDVKVSDDGNAVFVAKQTITALFGEARNFQPNGDGSGNSPGAGSLVAVDVSEPENPTVTSEIELSHWSVGPHNCWYHQIGGSEYVFTVHGTSGAASKTNVFEYDRSTGQFTQVNAWSWDTDLAQGEYGVESNQWYHHDINVQEDPKTGRPLAYLHCWNAGLRIYDVSDPTDVQEVGVFEQEGAHHAVPAPTLIDGKRVAVTGHENPDSHYHSYIPDDHPHGETGRYHLVDTDPLDLALFDDPADGGDPDVEKVYLGCSSTVQDGDAATALQRAPFQMYESDDDAYVVEGDGSDGVATELDTWVLIGMGDDGWEDAWGFETEAENAADEDEEPGPYDGFSDFRISNHNLDMDTEGRLYAGCYHAGMRAFQIVPGESSNGNGNPGNRDGNGPANDSENANENAAGAPPFEGGDGSADGWEIVPTAYFREGKEIPEESAMAFDTPEESPASIDGLTASTPFFWNGVERNGVVFSSGINAGPHAMRETHDGAADVGYDTPIDVDITREHDVPVSQSGQRVQVTIRADSEEDVVVRDAIPTEWEVVEAEDSDVDHVHEVEGYRTIVSLRLDDGEAVYYVESPESHANYTFGPVEYARADENGDPDVDGHWGGGNSTTNRLWRKDNAAVDSIGSLGL